MTVTIPSSYDTTDINSEGGVLFGVPVQYPGLRTIQQNHNFIGGAYTPPVGTYHNGLGIGTSHTVGVAYHNLTGISVPGQADGRGLVCKFEAKNDSTYAQRIRLAVCNTASVGQTIPASSGWTTYTETISATPGYLCSAALQCRSFSETADNTCKVRNAVWYWDDLSGSVSDTATSSGFVWAQQEDHKATEPLTVEQYNRFRGGPRVMFEAMPQTASSFVSSWYNPDNSNKTTRTLMGHIPILKRRNNLQIRFDVLAQGSLVEIYVPAASAGQAGTFYNVTPGISTSTVVYETSTSVLSVASSSTVDFTNHPLLTVCEIYITSPNTSTQARVFSVQAVVV